MPPPAEAGRAKASRTTGTAGEQLVDENKRSRKVAEAERSSQSRRCSVGSGKDDMRSRRYRTGSWTEAAVARDEAETVEGLPARCERESISPAPVQGTGMTAILKAPATGRGAMDLENSSGMSAEEMQRYGNRARGVEFAKNVAKMESQESPEQSGNKQTRLK